MRGRDERKVGKGEKEKEAGRRKMGNAEVEEEEEPRRMGRKHAVGRKKTKRTEVVRERRESGEGVREMGGRGGEQQSEESWGEDQSEDKSHPGTG